MVHHRDSSFSRWFSSSCKWKNGQITLTVSARSFIVFDQSVDLTIINYKLLSNLKINGTRLDVEEMIIK